MANNLNVFQKCLCLKKRLQAPSERKISKRRFKVHILYFVSILTQLQWKSVQGLRLGSVRKKQDDSIFIPFDRSPASIDSSILTILLLNLQISAHLSLNKKVLFSFIKKVASFILLHFALLHKLRVCAKI